ncbi:alpha-1-antitrypsin-like, partial [Heteronotia binoei]
MSTLYQSLLLAGLCALAHCHIVPEIQEYPDHHSHHSPDEDDGGSKTLTSWELAQDNDDDAFNYQHLALMVTSSNLIIAPVSTLIAYLFPSLTQSATPSLHFSELGFDSTELSEQKKKEGVCILLHMLNRIEVKLQMNIGNVIFTDSKVQELQNFLDDAENLYQNFSVCSKRYVETEDPMNTTDDAYGKLVDLIKDLDPDFVVAYINHTFLKAYTKNPFYYRPTQEEDFFLSNGTTVKAEMMHKARCYNTYFDKELSCEVVQMPYKSNTSAFFILPDHGKMKLVEEAIGEKLFQRWNNSLEPKCLDIHIPQLSQSTVKSSDRSDVFSDQSGISRKAQLKISKAIHKAHLNIHENGTETAATTLIEMAPTSFLPVFTFNKPFLFSIIDDTTGVTLIFGRVMNPNEPFISS